MHNLRRCYYFLQIFILFTPSCCTRMKGLASCYNLTINDAVNRAEQRQRVSIAAAADDTAEVTEAKGMSEYLVIWDTS